SGLPDKRELRCGPRRAGQGDMDARLVILGEAKAYLKESGVNQWQEGYPNREALLEDMALGRGWVFDCVDDGAVVHAVEDPAAPQRHVLQQRLAVRVALLPLVHAALFEIGLRLAEYHEPRVHIALPGAPRPAPQLPFVGQAA